MSRNRLPELIPAAYRPEVPDGRMIGRSTAIALREIAAAIDKSPQWVQVTDHYPTWRSDEHTWFLCQSMVNAMKLQFFEFKIERAQRTFWIRSTHLE